MSVVPRLVFSRLMLWILASAPVMVGASLSYTPEYVITQWTTEDGLPESSATSMVQTNDGYLWFGTFNGLVRFDGNRFAVFGPTNTPQFPNVGVVQLRLERSGGLLVSTLGGFARLEHGKWQSLATDPQWQKYTVRIAFDKEGSAYGLFPDAKIARIRNGRIESVPPPIPVFNEDPPHLVPDAQGRIHFLDSDHIFRLDGDRWTPLPLSPEVRAVLKDFKAIRPARDGNWLLASGKGFAVFNADRVLRTVPYSIVNAVHISEDGDGYCWVSSDTNGLYRIAPSGEVHRFYKGAGLPSNSLRQTFRDREGNLWVGTNGSGLVRMRKRTFRTLGIESGLPDLPVKSLAAAANGEMFVATYGKGLYVMRNGVARPFRAQDQQAAYAQSLLLDRAGTLWVGTYQRGLFTRQGDRLVHVAGSESCGSTIEALFEDSSGRVWIAGDKQTCSVRAGGGEIRQIPVESGKSPVPVAVFGESRSPGTIWAGGDGGLYKFDGSRFVPQHDHEGKALPALRAIAALNSGTLLLGTAIDGLRRFRNGVADAIRIPAPGAVGIGALVREGQDFWVATTRGIHRIPVSELENSAEPQGWHAFGAGDGIVAMECSVGHQPIVVRDSSGELWFATLKGTASLRPSALDRNPTDPATLVEAVLYRTENTEHRIEWNGQDTIELPADSWDIRIQYTTTALSFPHKVQFEYRLDHASGTLAAGRHSERELRLLRLPAGDNRLEIRTIRDDGLPGSRTISVTLRRIPHIWENLLFLLPAGLMVVLGAGWVVRRSMEAKAKVQEEELRHSRQSEEAMLIAKQKAEEASRLKSIFLANVSHELRTPMNGILGMTDLLRSSPLPPEQREMLDTVHASSQALLALVNDLLDLSLIEAGQLTLNECDFDLRETVRDVVALVVPAANRKGLQLNATVHPHVPARFFADAQRLRQILLNYLDNAIKFTARGAIELEVLPEGNERGGYRLRIAVKDTGCGIPQEKLEEIFSLFSQLDASATRRYEGAGLGLAITRRLARMMGGDAGADSLPGKGSTFWATVVLKLSDTPVSQPARITSVPNARHSGKVLVVEDNGVNRMVLQRLLARLGCEVTVCPDGASAVGRFRDHEYDLILMDVQMPVMDGLEATQRIRALGGRQVPIVGVSASAMYEDRSRCEVAGMDDFLAKPVTLEALDRVVRQFLGQSRQAGGSAS